MVKNTRLIAEYLILRFNNVGLGVEEDLSLGVSHSGNLRVKRVRLSLGPLELPEMF